MRKNYTYAFLILVFGLFFNTVSAQLPTFSISGNGSSGWASIEGNNYIFTVNLYSASTTPVIINLATATDTAGAADFTAFSTTVTIPAGELSSTPFTIATTNDAVIEPNEQFIINATVTSGNTAFATLSRSIWIIDNDAPPTVSISAYNPAGVIEGNSIGRNIALSNPYSSAIVIHFTAVAGTASIADFTATSTDITIPAGQSTAYINVATTNDALVEPDETFLLNGNVTSGNTANVVLAPNTMTIIDNDTTPTLILTHTNPHLEGSNARLSLKLSRAYNSTITVHFVTAPGTAGSGDFTATTVNATITAGNMLAYIDIPLTEDTLDEPLENFTVTGTVTVGTVTNPTITATVSILDNDGFPDLLTNVQWTGTVSEGLNFTYSYRITTPNTADTVIQVTTANGTAGSLDYSPVSTTVVIPAGRTYADSNPALNITTVLDAFNEGDETFTINAVVTSGNTYNSSLASVVTIINDYNVNAHYDQVLSIAEMGTTFQLLTNDTLHGLPLNASDVTITLGNNTIGATVNAQGIITIPASLPMGSYHTLNYTVCETANPANCDTETIAVEVVSPLTATYNALYSDYNGDGYTSAGDLITYQFILTNSGNAPITNILPVDWQGNGEIISGGPIASLGAGQSDTTTFTITRIITQNDINSGDFIQFGFESYFEGSYHGYGIDAWPYYLENLNLSISDGISARAFIDEDADGIRSPGEPDFPLGRFNYTLNNNGIVHNVYTNPFYVYESNPTTSYNVGYTFDSPYAAYCTTTASFPNITVPVGSGITDYDFPITITPYNDVSVYVSPSGASPRPGFVYSNFIRYKNNSNQVVPSGTITFTKDSALSIINISQTGAVVTPTGFTYAYTDLQPYESRYFFVKMQVPLIPTVSLGQLLTNTVSISLPAADVLTSNNTSSLTATIIGSWDPNDKTESHGGRILHSGFTANDYLTYTIRFENTGTASAINVKVTDVLDNKLDPSSIKMVDASAPYTLERIGANLTWNFFGIDLPPVVEGTDIGHGYITFQVKPKAGYALGDVIPNTANIYFDFNPAIVTNTCTTQFVNSLATQQFAFDNFKYYPNPVKNILSISNDNTIDSAVITSVLGQEVLSKKVNDLKADLDLSGLSDGVYFVKVNSGEQVKTIKIIKE